MIESSIRMGHQVAANRLCAGAVLQELGLVFLKGQFNLSDEAELEFLPAVRLQLEDPLDRPQIKSTDLTKGGQFFMGFATVFYSFL